MVAHVPSRTQLQALPDHVLELMLEHLQVSDCAACCCASQELNALGKVVLNRRSRVSQDDLPLLASLQDIQLRASVNSGTLPGSNILADVLRVIEYLPQALLYIAHNCEHLEELSLKLLSQATANSRGSVWDHPSLLKRPHFRLSEVWRHCTRLHSLTLVNIPSRLLGLDDASFQALATHCPGLQHLCIGHQGAEESIYHPEDYYCRAITDAALIELAQKCHQLKSVELLRCGEVTGQGVSQIARSCTGLTSFKLHNCPKVSERAIVQVFERCHELEIVNIVPARWSAVQDMLLWQTDGWGRWQLGFHALFTLAANCPNLKELTISEEHLEEAVVDSLGICTVLEGCRQLTKIAFNQLDMADSVFERMARQTTQLQALEMHDSNFTDLALAAVAKGCSQLAYLSMQGPRLRATRPGAAQRQPLVTQGDVTDAGLKAIAAHCTHLTSLHITRNACVTDKGVASLAEAPNAVLQQLQELVLDAVLCTWEGIQLLLNKCTGLRKLELFSLAPP
ncbi:hypothetical protein ABBQ38_014978 [Trebouxia sp. C0009 RCD-2024]